MLFRFLALLFSLSAIIISPAAVPADDELPITRAINAYAETVTRHIPYIQYDRTNLSYTNNSSLKCDNWVN